MSDITIGHNVAPDYAETVTARLEQDYAELLVNSEALLNEARALPKIVHDEYDLGVYASLRDRMRDTAARFKTFHTTEKEPHLRAGQAVDNFFFRGWEQLARR